MPLCKTSETSNILYLDSISYARTLYKLYIYTQAVRTGSYTNYEIFFDENIKIANK